MENNPYHQPITKWHPRSHILSMKSVAVKRAEDAIREGNALRELLRGKRVLLPLEVSK